jgi:hypothetical protein
MEVSVSPKCPVLYFGVALLCLASLFLSPAVPRIAADAPPGATALFPSPNERFGFGVLYGIHNYDVNALNAGWYYNWSNAAGAAHPGSINVFHTARTTETGLGLTPAVAQQIAEEDPGGLWLIGNEPDMYKQDNITPSQYAILYRQAYSMIKAYDPTAVVAAGGLVQPTPLRLGWLSAVWDAYQELYGGPMPADAWNIHNYILQEAPGQWGCGIPPGYFGQRPATYPFTSHDDLTLFQDHVRAMRQWMADHGQREKPLVISEFGILFPESSGFDLARVRTFFVNATNWLLTASDPLLGYGADENHLVQIWSWYSLDDTNFAEAGNTIAALMDPTTRQMRGMGQAFADQATPLRRPYVNLVPGRVRLQATSAAAQTAAVPVVIRATIQNRGNTATSQPFRVVIRDQQGNQIHAETINGMPARYGGNVVVQAAWQKPAGTDWKVIVLVDPDNAVNEANEGDNRWEVTALADLDVVSLAIQKQASGALDLVAATAHHGMFPLTGAQIRFWNHDQLLAQRALPDMSPGDQIETTFTWSAPTVGLHNLAVDVLLPPGVSDPILDNNRIGRDFLVASHRTYLSAISGPQFQSGATVGIQCRNVLVNPGFETGDLSGWTASPFATVMNAGCAEGGYCLYIGRGLNLDDDVSQAVEIRPSATAHLNFAWAIVTTETAPAQRDTLTVEIRSLTGQLLRTVQTLDNRDAHPFWFTSDFSLDEFAGQAIQLHFHDHNDGANVTAFFVDKVNLEVCERR